MTSTSTPAHALFQSRGWLIAIGIFSILVGFIAIGSPLIFSVIIAQFIGAFALVSGVFALFLAITSKHVAHRVLEIVLAIIRIAAGCVLLACVASSVAVITLIIAVFLMFEGLSFIFGAFKMRAHKGWVWTLVNGIAALVLGFMVWAQWPSSSAWVIGLFYGINSIFWGMSLLTMGLAAQKPAEG